MHGVPHSAEAIDAGDSPPIDAEIPRKCLHVERSHVSATFRPCLHRRLEFLHQELPAHLGEVLAEDLPCVTLAGGVNARTDHHVARTRKDLRRDELVELLHLFTAVELGRVPADEVQMHSAGRALPWHFRQLGPLGQPCPDAFAGVLLAVEIDHHMGRTHHDTEVAALAVTECGHQCGVRVEPPVIRLVVAGQLGFLAPLLLAALGRPMQGMHGPSVALTVEPCGVEEVVRRPGHGGVHYRASLTRSAEAHSALSWFSPAMSASCCSRCGRLMDLANSPDMTLRRNRAASSVVT